MHYTASRGQEEGEKERKELERAKMMQEGTLRELQAQLEALQNIQDAYDTATEQLNFVQVRAAQQQLCKQQRAPTLVQVYSGTREKKAHSAVTVPRIACSARARNAACCAAGRAFVCARHVR